MRPPGQTDLVRSFVCSLFAELGVPTTPAPRETLLIRDGFYCGRRFEKDGLAAVWFVEEDQVKLYGRDGRVHRVCSARLAESDQQRAA